MPKIPRKILFSLFAFVLFLLLIELASRFLELMLTENQNEVTENRGWQAEFFSTYFDWHDSDPELLWRFKPNLTNALIRTNSEGLLGGEIPSEKSDETVRILILGDSSPVGLGLASRDHAFDTILKYMLETDYLGYRNFEIINAAVSGYTSEQIKEFLRLRGWQYRPDLVVLYCGNNDASISGSFTDREIMEKQRLIRPRKILAHLAFYRILQNLLVTRAVPGDQSPEMLKVRVPAEQFGENLNDIARQCRSRNCPLIILKPPVPLIWPAGVQFKIFTHLTGQNGELIVPEPLARIIGRELKYCIDNDEFLKIYGNGEIYTERIIRSLFNDSLPVGRAIEYYSEKLEYDSKNHLLYNNLGVSFWQNGQYREADYSLKTARALYQNEFREDHSVAVKSAGSPYLYNIGVNLLSLSNQGIEILKDSTSEAFAYLDSALQNDYFSLRIKNEYYREINKISQRENLFVVDLPAVFRNSDGEKLFIDHCHPTFKGHYLIAEEILKVIKSDLKL